MFSNIAHEIEYEVHDALSEVQDVVWVWFRIDSHFLEISVIGAKLQLPQTCERVVTMHAVHSLAGNL